MSWSSPWLDDARRKKAPELYCQRTQMAVFAGQQLQIRHSFNHPERTAHRKMAVSCSRKGRFVLGVCQKGRLQKDIQVGPVSGVQKGAGTPLLGHGRRPERGPVQRHVTCHLKHPCGGRAPGMANTSCICRNFAQFRPSGGTDGDKGRRAHTVEEGSCVGTKRFGCIQNGLRCTVGRGDPAPTSTHSSSRLLDLVFACLPPARDFPRPRPA